MSAAEVASGEEGKWEKQQQEEEEEVVVVVYCWREGSDCQHLLHDITYYRAQTNHFLSLGLRDGYCSSRTTQNAAQEDRDSEHRERVSHCNCQTQASTRLA